MNKNVQIDRELFFDLLEYFLDGKTYLDDGIREQLQAKVESLVNRELFTKYKRAATPAEREAARQEYLDRRGILSDFRTDQEIKYTDR